MSDAAAHHGSGVLEELDGSKITPQHWKVMFISGMGFFTDAYDLFIIGVAMALLKQEWHVSSLAEGLVTSTALLASAVGAILFGRVADMLGRKRIYGFEVLVLAAGAIASAFSPNIWWLIAFRIVLGIGIGGDYPVSATILIVGPLIAAGLLSTKLSHDIIWRLLLAFGCVPALAVFQMRRHLAETPRFLLANGQHDEFHHTTSGMLGRAQAGSRPGEAKPARSTDGGRKVSFWEGFGVLTRRRDLLVRLIGASLAWFLMDFAYYGNTVSSPLVLAAIAPDKSLLSHVLTQLAVFAVAAAPGYLIAAAMMDRIGRKSIQVLGFAMMALTFGVIALMPSLDKLVIPFLIVYGISYFFTEFGPNSTTFVYPAEIFPVKSRTTGHGVASSAGKLGGFFGVFLFPILMSWHGLLAAESAAALVSVIGIVVTLTMLPETNGKSLEELSPEEQRQGVGGGVAAAA